jgi:hypothetical protein
MNVGELEPEIKLRVLFARYAALDTWQPTLEKEKTSAFARRRRSKKEA